MDNSRCKLWCKLCLRLVATLIGVVVLQQAKPLAAQSEPQFYARAPIAQQAQHRISVALLGGAGFTLNPRSIDRLNAFGAGFGARGGYNIHALYIGVRLQFFMGDSLTQPTGELTFDETMIGLETGYDFTLGIVTLRPQVGFGLAMSSAELLADNDVTSDQSSDDVYVAPGLSVLVNPDNRLFVGVDAQFPFVLRAPTLNGLTLLLAVGMRF